MMPLIKSGSRSAISENIKTERASGKPEPQAVAIAESVADRAGRGRSADSRGMSHGGAPAKDNNFSARGGDGHKLGGKMHRADSRRHMETGRRNPLEVEDYTD